MAGGMVWCTKRAAKMPAQSADRNLVPSRKQPRTIQNAHKYPQHLRGILKGLLRRARDIQGNIVCVQVERACYAGRVLM
eukprot:614993-Pyramimonas_sp.AAC.1